MLNFTDWVYAIRYRWKVVAAVFVLCPLLALAYIIVTPPTYRATSSLLVDTRSPDPIKDAKAESDNVDADGMIATQVDLIKSPTVTDLAASSSGIDKDPVMVAQWRSATGGNQPYQLWLRDRLLRSLSVVPGKDSNVVLIQAVAKSPEAAARIANGYANASVESQQRLRTEPAQANAAWLTGRLSAARQEVVASQEALSAFVRAKGITNDGDMSAEGSQMASVATQLAGAEAAAAAARQSAYEDALGKGDSESSTVVQNLRTQVAQAQSRYSNLRAQFGPEYPDVMRAEAEYNALNSQLSNVMSTTTRDFGAARAAETAARRAAATASESTLRSLASQQRGRVQEIGTNLAQFQRLRNEFQVAQSQYAELSNMLGRVNLQGSIPRTEVQVLDLADAPIGPEWPNPALLLFLSLLMGGLLGALAAIVLEALNPRVRNWRSVERLLGTRVIGSVALSSPRRKERPRLFGPRLRLAGPQED